MIIRLEDTKDYREVENLTREAFWNVYRPGCTEHYVLNHGTYIVQDAQSITCSINIEPIPTLSQSWIL